MNSGRLDLQGRKEHKNLNKEHEEVDSGNRRGGEQAV